MSISNDSPTGKHVERVYSNRRQKAPSQLQCSAEEFINSVAAELQLANPGCDLGILCRDIDAALGSDNFSKSPLADMLKGAIKRALADQRLHPRTDRTQESFSPGNEPCDRGPDPHSFAIIVEEAVAVNSAIKQLSSEDREILQLLYWDSGIRKQKDAALKLQFHQGTITRRITRALDRLGRLLQDHNPKQQG